MSIAYLITHVPTSPQRRAHVRQLQRQLPNPIIVADPHREGIWPTQLRAWHAGLDTGADHLNLLQDDTILCRNYHRTTLLHTQLLPHHVILHAHYRKSQTPDPATRWYRTRDAIMGIQTLLPRDRLQDWLNWLDTSCRFPLTTGSDLRLAFYLIATNQDAWVAYPSLVQHADTPSLVGHPRGRGARDYINTQHDYDPLALDWTPPATTRLAPVNGYVLTRYRKATSP